MCVWRGGGMEGGRGVFLFFCLFVVRLVAT